MTDEDKKAGDNPDWNNQDQNKWNWGQDWGQDNKDEKVEVPKSEYEKLKQENQNKSKAIEDERKARKDAEAKAKAYEDEKAKQREDELKQSWKYEEIIAQKDEQLSTKDKQIEELWKQVWEYKSFYEQAQEWVKSENEKLLKEIPDEEKEFVNEAISWKDLQAKNKLLKWFAEKFKKPDFWKKAWGDSGNTPEEKKKAEEDEAKKGWFKSFAWKVAQDIFKRKE